MSCEDSTFAMQFSMSAPFGQSSTAESNDFSSKIVVLRRSDRFVFAAIRYHIERLRDTTGVATEIAFVDAKDPTYRKLVPLATGSGIVRTSDAVIKYRVHRNEISLRSRNKSLLYDFVYESLDAYDKIFLN